jgi:hypothetical protein
MESGLDDNDLLITNVAIGNTVGESRSRVKGKELRLGVSRFRTRWRGEYLHYVEECAIVGPGVGGSHLSPDGQEAHWDAFGGKTEEVFRQVKS